MKPQIKCCLLCIFYIYRLLEKKNCFAFFVCLICSVAKLLLINRGVFDFFTMREEESGHAHASGGGGSHFHPNQQRSNRFEYAPAPMCLCAVVYIDAYTKKIGCERACLCVCNVQP